MKHIIIERDRDLKALVKQALQQKEVYTDTETEGFDWLRQKMCMVQLAFQGVCYLIDISKCDVQLLKPLFESREVCKVIHGSLFDCTWLKWEHDIDTYNIYDTMQGEKIMLGVVVPVKPPAGMTKPQWELLKPPYSSGLSYCLHRRGLPDKMEFEEFTYGKPWTKNQIKYSVRDVEFLQQIKEDQLHKIDQLQLMEVLELENSTCEILYAMSCRGFGIDEKGYRAYATELDTFYSNSIKELSKFADINWGAPGQTCKFFGVKYIAELEALDVNSLEVAKRKAYTHWKNARQFKTAVSTFGHGWLDKHVFKGRVHCQYTQIVNTGRLSCDSPNLQNIPVKNGFKHRGFFIPAKGNAFGIADFSGQELAIMAVGSQEPVWLETLRAGKDLHQKCADLMSKVSGQEVPRRMAKTLNFTMGYGGGWSTVQLRLKNDYDIEITEEEAQHLISVYFRTFPKLKTWLDDNGKFAIKHGVTYSFSPFNRRRVLALETEDWRKKNIGKNSPVQGTGADMTKLAMHYINMRLKDDLQGRGFLVHQLHDELIVEAPKKLIKQCVAIMVEEMNNACIAILDEALSAPSVHIQYDWAKAA